MRCLLAGGVAGAAVLLPLVVAILPLNRRWRLVDYLLSVAASAIRGFAGSRASIKRKEEAKGGAGPPPPILVLYEYETCPFCRLVRETLTALDLDFEMRPCPMPSMSLPVPEGVKQGLSRHRPELSALGGKMQVPFLIDGDMKTYESSRIIEYLLHKYAAEPPPSEAEREGALRRWAVMRDSLRLLTSGLASHLRGMLHMGLVRVPSRPAALPLELVSYEAHPGARLVREALCALELRYVVRTTPLGSSKRRGPNGRSPPWLVDPNTGFETGDCHAAADYLYDTYATGDPPHGAESVTWVAFTRRRMEAMRGLVKSLWARVGPLSV